MLVLRGAVLQQIFDLLATFIKHIRELFNTEGILAYFEHFPQEPLTCELLSSAILFEQFMQVNGVTLYLPTLD